MALPADTIDPRVAPASGVAQGTTGRPIVAYGRSFGEYCAMFGLSDADAVARIVGIGDGPSDFNAQAPARGWRVVSADPLYRWPLAEVERRSYDGIDQMIRAIALAPTHWIWTRHASIESLQAHRRATTANFLRDFASPTSSARYVAAALPALPFRAGTFDLAVCSHLLFNWSDVIGSEFHLQAVFEMLRVAAELRICPTGRNLSIRRSSYATAVCDAVAARGYRATFRNIRPGRADASSECLVIARAPAGGK